MNTALIAFSAIFYFPLATGLANTYLDKTRLSIFFCYERFFLQVPIANLLELIILVMTTGRLMTLSHGKLVVSQKLLIANVW